MKLSGWALIQQDWWPRIRTSLDTRTQACTQDKAMWKHRHTGRTVCLKQRQRRECHCCQPHSLRRGQPGVGREDRPWESSKGAQPCCCLGSGHLVSRTVQWSNPSLLFQATQFVVLRYSSPRNSYRKSEFPEITNYLFLFYLCLDFFYCEIYPEK